MKQNVKMENIKVGGNINTKQIKKGKKNDKDKKPPKKRLKILFVASNPLSTSRLKLEEEMRKIKNAIKLSAFTVKAKLVIAPATRFDDFMQHLLAEKPQIVHFSGHGSKEGIFLLDDYDDKYLLKTKHLKAIFKQFSSQIDCVILNSCYSEAQGIAIRKHISHVVGMAGSIPDDSAIAFSNTFYASMAANNDVLKSFELAKTALGAKGLYGDHLLKLL